MTPNTPNGWTHIWVRCYIILPSAHTPLTAPPCPTTGRRPARCRLCLTSCATSAGTTTVNWSDRIVKSEVRMRTSHDWYAYECRLGGPKNRGVPLALLLFSTTARGIIHISLGIVHLHDDAHTHNDTVGCRCGYLNQMTCWFMVDNTSHCESTDLERRRRVRRRWRREWRGWRKRRRGAKKKKKILFCVYMRYVCRRAVEKHGGGSRVCFLFCFRFHSASYLCRIPEWRCECPSVLVAVVWKTFHLKNFPPARVTQKIRLLSVLNDMISDNSETWAWFEISQFTI